MYIINKKECEKSVVKYETHRGLNFPKTDVLPVLINQKQKIIYFSFIKLDGLVSKSRELESIGDYLSITIKFLNFDNCNFLKDF